MSEKAITSTAQTALSPYTGPLIAFERGKDRRRAFDRKQGEDKSEAHSYCMRLVGNCSKVTQDVARITSQMLLESFPLSPAAALAFLGSGCACS